MNTALKQTIIAMATAALGFTAGCSSSESPEGSESSTGGETATEASCSGAAEGEASCSGASEGEASCSGEAEASCGEGSCG